MRTEVLQYIVEVDKEQSISQAARNLFISKSALERKHFAAGAGIKCCYFHQKEKGNSYYRNRPKNYRSG